MKKSRASSYGNDDSSLLTKFSNFIFFSSFITMPFYVEYKILNNLPIVNGSEVYENWVTPPVTPRMMLYVFNLTNLEAFLSGAQFPAKSYNLRNEIHDFFYLR